MFPAGAHHASGEDGGSENGDATLIYSLCGKAQRKLVAGKMSKSVDWDI